MTVKSDESATPKRPSRNPRDAALAWVRRGEWEPVLGVISVTALLVLWQVAAWTGLTNELYSSSPIGIFEAGREYVTSPDFVTDLSVSGQEFVVGVGIAVLVGIPLGLAMGWYRWVNAMLDPIVTFAYASPRVAIMPLLTIWFGIDKTSKVALVFLMAIFPIVINTSMGVRQIDVALLRVAKSFNASDWKICRTVILPGAVPSIISGLRLAIGVGLIGIVVGEFVAATAGIGHMMQEASGRFQTDLVFVGLFLLAGTGVLLTSLLRRLEKKFEVWRPSLNS